MSHSRNQEIILPRSIEGESRNREWPIVLTASDDKITGEKWLLDLTLWQYVVFGDWKCKSYIHIDMTIREIYKDV